MSNAHITFLKDLLRRAEEGELLIVDSRVLDEFQETTLEEYGGVQHSTSQLTGEQDWYFTTRPRTLKQEDFDAFLKRLMSPSPEAARALNNLGVAVGEKSAANPDNPYQAYTWEHIASLVPALIRARKTLVLSDDEFEQKATWARHSINTILTDPKPNPEIYTVLTDALGDLHRELDAIGRPGL